MLNIAEITVGFFSRSGLWALIALLAISGSAFAQDAADLAVAEAADREDAAVARSPGRLYVEFALEACDRVEAMIDEKIVPVAEKVADRHIDGGLLGFPWNGQAVQQELNGRSGNMMYTSYSRAWEGRDKQLDKHNVGIISWENDDRISMRYLEREKAKGQYTIGFGPSGDPALAAAKPLIDVWFTSPGTFDTSAVTMPDGRGSGNPHLMYNALTVWVLQAEVISALTRRGKSPPIWKAFAFPDGRDWMEKYFQKDQYHTDYSFDPIPEGELARKFLDGIRDHILRFEETEFDDISRAADLVAAEVSSGTLVPTASIGHMPWTYVGKGYEQAWTTPLNFHGNNKKQLDEFSAAVKDGSLVVVLGYCGLHAPAVERLRRHNQRTIMISTPNQVEDYRIPRDLPIEVYIDMGYAFGDAMIEIPNYPIKLLPPSGIMQLVAFEMLSAEVLSRIGPGHAE